MSKPAINNANIIIEEHPLTPETRTARRKRLRAQAAEQSEAQNELLRRQIDQIREKIFSIACSSAWAEDCLYRGIEYAPNFRCRCLLCEAKFPDRLYPRQARESNISIDCQAEGDDDPELAEELARLRNERARVGSVFIAVTHHNRNTAAGGKKGETASSGRESSQVREIKSYEPTANYSERLQNKIDAAAAAGLSTPSPERSNYSADRKLVEDIPASRVLST
jgi:hypothetical protein